MEGDEKQLFGIAALEAMNVAIRDGTLHDEDEEMDEAIPNGTLHDEDEAIENGTRGKRRAAAPDAEFNGSDDEDPGRCKLEAQAKRQKASIARLKAQLKVVTANNREVQAELKATAQQVDEACAQAAKACAQAKEANEHKEALSQELKDLKAPAGETLGTCVLCMQDPAEIIPAVCKHAFCCVCVGMSGTCITDSHRFELAFGLTGEDPELKCPACYPMRKLELAEIHKLPEHVFAAAFRVTSSIQKEGVATMTTDARMHGRTEAIEAWQQATMPKFATDNVIGASLGILGKCPYCGQVWTDHDACLAVQCGKCLLWSCGLCEKKCGSGTMKEGHDHVKVCEYNPARPSYWPTDHTRAARASWLRERARQKLAELKNSRGVDVRNILLEPAAWVHLVCHGPEFFFEIVVRPVLQGMDDDQRRQLMRKLEAFENTRDRLPGNFDVYEYVLTQIPELRQLVEAAPGEGVPEAAPGEGVAEAGELTAGDEQIAEAFAVGLFNEADVHRLADIYPNIDRAHIVQVYQRHHGCMLHAIEELLDVHL